MLPLIIVGVCVALAAIVAFITFCTPCGACLYVLDCFTEAYRDKYDENTQVAIKHKKRTSLGGFVTIIAFGLVGGMILLQVFHFATDVKETMIHTSPSLSETKAIIPHYKNKKIILNLTLHDYSGKCVDESNNCHSELGIWKDIYHPNGLLLLLFIIYLFCLTLF